MTYAQTQLDVEVVDASIINRRTEDLNVTRVVFFAGDAIPPHEKYEMPEVKGAGGIYMPHIRTLPKGNSAASRGMIYKCKFTPLKTRMISEWNMMLPPEAREHWDASYEQTVIVDGVATQRVVKGFLQSDLAAAKKGRLELEPSDHIVSKKRYPGQDIKKVTTRSIPNGVGGVVEIEALKGATNAEIAEAQYFFFPNWGEIADGRSSLPLTIDEVESHIKNRIASIATQGWSADKQTKYQMIGRDMVKSCVEFRRTGTQIIEKDDSILKIAAKDGDQGHSAVSSHLLDQLKIQRKGDLLAGDHSAINRLAEIMEKKETSADTLKAKELELKEREIALREIELGIRKPEPVATVSYPQETVTTALVTDVTTDTVTVESLAPPPSIFTEEVRICGKPTANGECKRELKEGDVDACWQHK